MKTTPLAYLIALGLLSPSGSDAATWMGNAEDEYSAAGVISSLPFSVTTRSGTWSVDLDYGSTAPEPDNTDYLLIYFVNFTDDGPTEPWTSVNHQVAGSFLAINYDYNAPTTILGDMSVGGLQEYYYGEYWRGYSTSFRVDIDLVYDGKGNWSGAGTWEYHSDLAYATGPLPTLPDAGGTLALAGLAGLAMMGTRRWGWRKRQAAARNY